MSDYITPIAAIFGSGVVVAVISHFLTVRQAQIEFKKAKLEETFLTAAEYKGAIPVIVITINHIQIQTIPISDGRAKIESLLFTSHKDYDKVMMLANVYNPSLIVHWTRLSTSRKAISNILAGHLVFNRLPPDQAFLSYAKQLETFNDDYATFNEALYVIARKQFGYSRFGY